MHACGKCEFGNHREPPSNNMCQAVWHQTSHMMYCNPAVQTEGIFHGSRCLSNFQIGSRTADRHILLHHTIAVQYQVEEQYRLLLTE